MVSKPTRVKTSEGEMSIPNKRRALGVQVVRYADDFVIISRSQHIILRYIKPRVTDFLLERGLTLSSEKTRMFTLQDENAKQMVLSAALDSGYVFVVLIAILTSVISAVYYLNIIKEVFFYKTDYKFNSNMHQSSFNSEQNIILSSYLTITISILTLLILLFICFSVNLLDLVNILSLSFL
ncbi:NADH-ubiquinone oxidoreductase chain 2 [Erysiphe neolycopersici]|uniref:NADH-ubiquinone oxidoreductase chain 2 n=1 Tax=Erysiphe neolycopersici TaxID=212602 RepID=A0A420HJ70_9PEZI|nr:NADH-ubiquinone oxidoreductase chain 2 [Erysiphe neolycopersici]